MKTRERAERNTEVYTTKNTMKKYAIKSKQGKMYKETINKRKKKAHGNTKTNKERCTKKH